MTFEWGYLFGMVLQTVPEPRKVAREILSLRLPRAVLWQALALLLVASTWLGVIGGILFPLDPAEYGPLMADPVLVGVVESLMAGFTIIAIYGIGRVLGGKGTLDQAILTMIWLQFVLLIVELGVLFLSVIAPGLAVILWLLGIGMTFWIPSHFITEMHGFRSAGMVFVGMILTLFVLVILLSLAALLIGVGVSVEKGTF